MATDDAEYERIRGTYVYKSGYVPDKSRETPDALRATLRDSDGHLAGQAEFIPARDEDEYGGLDSLVVAALGAAGAVLVVTAGSHIKGWWSDRARRNPMVAGAQKRAIAQESSVEHSARVADAAELSTAWQEQQALAQREAAEHSERAANAAQRQAWIAQRAAEEQRRIAEQAAEQARRAQFALWRQTPDGRVYEQWKHQAMAFANDGVVRVRHAMEFHAKVAAAHAQDISQSRSLHPDPGVLVAPPPARPLRVENKKLSSVVGVLPVVGDWVRDLSKAKEREAAAQYDAAVGQWREYQDALGAARLGRRAYLGGASENPNQVPEWWAASVVDSGFMPTPEAIQSYEVWAMREFPSPNQLPRLARVSFRVLDSVPGGPEVQKAVGWYRWQDRSSRVLGITGRV